MHEWTKKLTILILGIIIGIAGMASTGVAFGYITLGKDVPKPEDPIPVKYWNENLQGLTAHDGGLITAESGFVAPYGVIVAHLQGDLARAIDEAKVKDHCLTILPAVPDPSIKPFTGIKVTAIDGGDKDPVTWGGFVTLNDSENSHSGNQTVMIDNENARWAYLVALNGQIDHYKAIAGSSCQIVAEAKASVGNNGDSASTASGEGNQVQNLHPTCVGEGCQSGFESTTAIGNTDGTGSAGGGTTPADPGGTSTNGGTATVPAPHGPATR